MNGILVKLGVDESHIHPLNGFVSDRPLHTDFVEGFNDELPGLVKVLDTLRVVHENVRPLDGIDLPHGIFVHTVFAEFVANFLGVAASDRTVAEFTCSQGCDDLSR